MKLMVITGMPGSGKEEFLKIAESFGIPFVRMGDVVRSYHQRSDGSMNTGEFAGSERKRHGFNIWAKRTLEEVRGDIYLIDGCRSMDEVRAFKELTDDVSIIAIHTSPKTRYERLVQRGREDAPQDPDEFEERDEREIGWGIAEVIVLSDVMIINEGTLDDLRQEARDVLDVMK